MEGWMDERKDRGGGREEGGEEKKEERMHAHINVSMWAPH